MTTNTNTNASNTEASLSITLTDEALSSLPVYVSRVREPQSTLSLRRYANSGRTLAADQDHGAY